MAQQQKPKVDPESEWEEIPDPRVTDNEWEEISDPTQSASEPFEEQGPPAPQQISEPTDWLGGFSKSVLGGDALHASDESARGWLQGAILDLPHGLYEGGKMLATTNPLGYAAYHLAGKKMPVEEMAEGLKDLPANLWEAGKMSGSHPYEFGRMLGNVTGQPAMTEGLFGNVPGLPSGVDIAKVAGKGIETTGRIMKNYAPFSDIGTRVALGTVGHSAYGPMGGALGGIYGRAPKFLKGLESAAGDAIERGGQWMRNIDGSVDAAALEDFWGKNSPDAQPPILRISSMREGGTSDPILESSFHLSDAEALRQFRESQGPPVPPIEPNIIEGSNPILESPFNESDIEALRPFNESRGNRVPPTQATIIDSSDPFSRAPLSEEPHPPEPPPASEPNVGTGSAFEKYMQAKAQAARAAGKVLPGEEAPMLDIEGNEIPPEVSDVATKAGASINPDMEIKWPKKPTASELSKMQKAGFQFDSATNIFRKFKKAVTEGLENFGSNEAGTFTPGEMFDNLKQLLGRDPSDAELGAAVRRQVQPGEPTGAVAPFLTAEERAQRLDDLGNVPQTTEPPRLPRFLEEDPQFAPIPGADSYTGAAEPPLTPAERGWTNSAMEPSGDINALRSQSVMDSPRTMDPRMAARVEAGGPREFDFTKPNPDTEIKKFLDSEDTQIADYLKSEDAHPPEATDITAWKKLKDLGKRLLGDESGEFDPNTLWWNLRRYFDRAPTEAELTRGMEIDPEFKVGARREEILNRPWGKEPISGLDETGKKFYPSQGLRDAADDLWEAVRTGKITPNSQKLADTVKQHIDSATDVQTAKQNMDDLATMADNAETGFQGKTFDALYMYAKDVYRKLRNPGLESPKPNRAKLIEDAFPGEIQAVRGEDVAREHMAKAKELINDGHVTEARKIISDITKKLTPRLADKITKEWQKFENEFFGDSEDAFGPKADIPPIDKWDTGPIRPRDDLNEKLYGPPTDKWDAAITDDPDRTPSKLPPGHVDIEGTRFIDLGQQTPNQSADVPLKFGYNLSDTLKNNPEAFKKGTNPAFDALKEKARKLGINPDDFPEPTMYENPLADTVKKAEKRSPSEQTKRARKSDDLWRILIGGDKPKFWEESNIKAEELINKTTDRETLESYGEALDDWADEHTKDTDHRMAGWMKDLKKLVTKKLADGEPQYN